MRLLRSSGYRRMPWKNGGGETTEIAVSPEGAGLDDFDWRVSMARVEAGGAFSLFPGVDRTLSILEGEGLSLEIEGRDPVAVTCASAPLNFPADAPTSARLIAGAVVDLNVMSRRGRKRHRVRRLSLERPAELALAAKETLLFCHFGTVRAGLEGEHIVLGARDTLQCGRSDFPLSLGIDARTEIFLVEIDAFS